MRRLTLLLSLFALAGIANANLLINPEFENPSGGWIYWWGGHASRYVPDPVESDHCARTVSRDDGMYQELDIGPAVYTVTGSLLHYDLGNGMLGVISAELCDDWGRYISGSQIVISQNDPAGMWLTGSTVIDNTTAGAAMLRINLYMLDQNSNGTGSVYFDNISVVPEPATLVLFGCAGLLLRRYK